MRITDLVIVDKQYREYRKTQTLLNTIQKRLHYYEQHNQDLLSQGHKARALQQMAQLQNHLTRLDSNEFKSQSPRQGEALAGASIPTWYPAGVTQALRAPVRDTLAGIFTWLPQPRPAQLTDVEKMTVDYMAELGKTQRTSQYRAQLAYEIAYRAKLGWFMIFNTLTVSPGEYGNVFGRNSTAFKYYIQRVDRAIAQQVRSTGSEGEHGDYHTYFAVVEEGGKFGRLHIHCVHFMSKLPGGSSDPNYGLPLPTRRELNTLKSLWDHGFSSPIIVRYSPLDAFGRIQFRWPYDTRTEKPLTIGSPQRLASYLTKYITKSYSSPKRSKLLWRIRKSHSLGNDLLQELLSTLTPQSLLMVATSSSLTRKLNNQRIPTKLLRLQALLQYQRIKSSENPDEQLHNQGKHMSSRPSLLTSLRGSTLTSTTNNQQNTGNIPTIITNVTAAYNIAKTEMDNAAERINNKYFQQSNNRYGTASVKDHAY